MKRRFPLTLKQNPMEIQKLNILQLLLVIIEFTLIIINFWNWLDLNVKRKKLDVGKLILKEVEDHNKCLFT